MTYVSPKKALGQHFLKDLTIAGNIAHALQANEVKQVIEIGPGTGVLTRFLLERNDIELYCSEIDTESVDYLREHFPTLGKRLVHGDFLRQDLARDFKLPCCVIGNFPYNISSQLFFRILEYRNDIPEVVCMIQKEVAERLAAGPGSKTYGILSVLLQAYYQIDYLFTVSEHVFNPPPKVKSGVIRLVRNEVQALDCDEKLFKQIIKTTFNQRRKTIRNSIKPLLTSLENRDPSETPALVPDPKQSQEWDFFMQQRPEQLSVNQFVRLTQLIQACRA